MVATPPTTPQPPLQMLRRKSYGTLQTPANYYPMPTAAIVEDGKKRITVGKEGVR